MADYVTLLGAEQVQSAGHNMKDAADSMLRAAGIFDRTLHEHRMFMEDWLARFEQVLANHHHPNP
jgi:hypothetical protein